MPNSVRALTRIQDADDLAGALTDTYVPVWSSAQGKFVMTAESGGGNSNHAALSNLSYAAAGHTGFAGTGVANTFSFGQTFATIVGISGGSSTPGQTDSNGLRFVYGNGSAYVGISRYAGSLDYFAASDNFGAASWHKFYIGGVEKLSISASSLSLASGMTFSVASKPTISGSRGGNAALASLLTGLAALGLITDSSTA